MKLLTRQDLQPLFLSRPEQRDYTLKRYFHPWQKIPYLARFKLVLKLLNNQYFENFLDIGFGSGIFTPELKERCRNFYGIDIHPEIEIVKKIVAGKNIPATLLKANITNLPFPDDFFDGILCLSVLEFVADTQKAILEIKRVAKKNTTIIIGIPVLNPVTDFIYSKVVNFKNHSLSHQASHQKIIRIIQNNLKITQILKYPRWLPEKYSLFLALKVKKII